ncbi:YafY family protein [uncultured Brevibacillus sp.]|uniref:helix-turn-helix transcriptional regulator n=1 Tax=uncultured Brevibacillus sp. TaxID=169970 RepID=UPI00259520D7|nr:YafY family protein [uncultured Brevibacillus sp.]
MRKSTSYIKMRVDRLLSMLLILSKREMVTGKELADGEAGIPIASIGGKGGGYYLMENYQVDNLFFNKSEAHTFMAVLNNLDLLFGKNEKFNDIVLKLENTYKQEKRDSDKWSIQMSHFSMEKELKEYLFLMNQAIEESKLLVFDYINRDMEYSEREVEPVQIAFVSGQWYLVGFCRKRNDYRRFKLVRIRKLRVDTSFHKRETSWEEIEKIIEESYSKRGIEVTFRFSNRIGEQLTEYFSKEAIRKTEDDHYIVVAEFPYEEGLLKYILSFGKECEVVEPLFLREELKQYVKELMNFYNG